MIHATQIAEHLEEWWAAGWFFASITAVEIVLALLLLINPTAGAVRLALWTSAAALLVWGVSRSLGLPFGPDRWLPERVGRPDLAASFLETITIVAGILWVRNGGRSVARYGAGLSTLLISVVIGGSIAFALTAPADCATHGDDWPFGPLVPVDGHAMVYQSTPVTKASTAERVPVVVGYLKNCGARALRLERVSLSTFGSPTDVDSTRVVPARFVRGDNTVGRAAFRAKGTPVQGRSIPPTAEDPDYVLVADVVTRRGEFDEDFSISAVFVTYRTRWRNFRAPFGSAARVEITKVRRG